MRQIRRIRRRLIFFGLPAFLILIPACRTGEKAPPADRPETSTAWTGLDGLDRPPAFHSLLQFSSHNREGLNGDSQFFLYRDERGDAVILDVSGPGCVRSIWSTDIREGAVFNFYFDGEPDPRFRIPMLDFFQGRHELFPPPLVSYERRGYYGERPFAGNCFVPIPFAEGMRISISGPFEFYHILCECFPHGSRVVTFTGNEDHARLLRAFEDPDEPAGPPPAGERLVFESPGFAPADELEVFRIERPGRLLRLELETAAEERLLENLELRLRWDGHVYQDVRAPIGFFFGVPVRPRDFRTLPFRVDWEAGGRARWVCRFPMPFRESAEIALALCSGPATGPLRMAAVLAPLEDPGEEVLYFTTRHRRGETVYGRDWPLFVTPGAGRLAGVVQTMLGAHYCEGDERIALDGAVSPQINGTGSEDYYLACFWPNRNFNSPFANHVGDVREHGERTGLGDYGVPGCYSRFHLEAPVPFAAFLDARIQHGGMSHIRSAYASLAYAYLRPRPALRESDFLDVADPAGEEIHGYRADSSEPTGTVDGFPEGGEWRGLVREWGRRHSGGEIRFRIAVPADNRGVRLRRRLDQAEGRQAAEVWIDGERVGLWSFPDRNPHLRWFDSDFDIHPRYTAGKSALDVRLKVLSGQGRGLFTDFWYRVFAWIG